MSKYKQPFRFTIPVTQNGRADGTIKALMIGKIEVDGIATLYHSAEPEIDYNSIMWNGVDIFLLLDNCPGFDGGLDYVHEHATAHVLENYSIEEIVEHNKGY